LRGGDDFRVQETIFGGNPADVEELVGGERFGNAELEVVGRERRGPGSGGEFRRTIERENAMRAAELGATDRCGFGFAEETEFGSATMNRLARKLRIESGGFCAGAGGV